MPFYLRKSLSFGPVRFNLSKSGIGVSAGVKGFRVGANSRGNYVHMGRHGLYYRAALSSTPTRSVDRVSSPRSLRPPPVEVGNRGVVMEAIDSQDATSIIDASSREIVNEITEKRAMTKFAPLVGITGLIVSLVPLASDGRQWLALVLGCITLACVAWAAHADKRRTTTVVFYDLDEEAEARYKALHSAFELLGAVGRLWHIPSRGRVHDAKYHSGASSLVNRTCISVGFTNPPGVVTNIPTPSLQVGSQTMYFFPERVLIYDSRGVGGLGYESIKIEIGTTRFIETEPVPRDSQIVDRTWRYVNKRGGPDKRFKDNTQIPIVLYEEVRFSSATGVNEVLQVSRVGAFAPVTAAIQATREFIAKNALSQER
ncbi:DUF4236 domain-containing protein [Opitutales bacterium ASA1]|uniref:DUF4236 domain-containing protein n=1 Tax=Congregicoccus parvus TaxID=3081749 RepID=UPI002B280F5F|nr:DUF4236 domain-containing protein [Opitutales bacterium ASA1]